MAASDAERVFAELIGEAAAAAERGRWEDAARRWTVAAGLARDRGAGETAAELYGSAGEAFRRADRPRDALGALQLALALRANDLKAHVALSAVLASMGRMDAALQHARVSAEHPLAVDAEVGVLLSVGRRAEISAAIQRLEGPTAEIARRFRLAQWLRMEGRLGDALDALGSLLVDVPDPVAQGGIRVEMAELDALQGRLASAVFEAAADDHRRAGRMALVWTTVAVHLRCLCDAGAEPLDPGVDQGIAWASERGLDVLALDLGIVRARVRRDERALRGLRDRALEVGLPRRAGRAELARSGLLTLPGRLLALQDAAHWLAEDRPLALRAQVARAEALAGPSGAGTRLAKQLVRAVSEAGMEPERQRLLALEV